MNSIRLLLLASAFADSATAAYQFAHGGGICAATGADTATYLGVQGDHGCTDIDTIPDEYISMKFEKMAFLKGGDSAYLTDTSKMTEVSPSAPSRRTRARVGPTASIINGPGFKIAEALAGTMMGDLTGNVYGFIGTASYLMMEGEYSYNTNNFKIATNNNWATRDVKDVCVVPLKDGECDADGKRTATPGTYKFSLYGYTDGKGYKAFASAYTHVGVRQKVNVGNMGVGVMVGFSGGEPMRPAYSETGASAITNVTIIGDKTTVEIAYPSDYNVGSVNYAGIPLPAATQQVIINAVPNDENSFYLDFIFAINHGLEDRLGYFVYDPDVSFAHNGSNSSFSSVFRNAFGVVVFALANWIRRS